MDDIIPQNVPQKQCSKCKEWKPCTEEFFYPHRTQHKDFLSECKTCQRARRRKHPDDTVPSGYKRCTKCQQTKPATEAFFGRRSRNSSGLMSQCRDCLKGRNAAIIDRAHPGQQQCLRCSQWKPATPQYFFPYKPARTGLRSICRDCKKKPPRDESIPDGYRRCSQCKEAKPATTEYFHAQKSSSFGLASACKQCRYAEIMQERVRSRRLLRYKHYYRTHKTAINAYNRQYSSDNRVTIRQKTRERYQLHPRSAEKIKMYNHRRRARHLQAQGSHTAIDIRKQYERQKGRCYYCGKKLGASRGMYTIDHVIPLSRGGSNSPDNIVVACKPCNSSKHNLLPHEWSKGGRLL